MNTILVAANPQVRELILCSYLHIGSLLPDSSNSTRCTPVPFQTVRIRDDSFLFLSLTSIPRFENQPPSVPHNSVRINYSEAQFPMTEYEASYPGITQYNHPTSIEHKQHDTVTVCQRVSRSNLWNKVIPTPFLLVFMWLQWVNMQRICGGQRDNGKDFPPSTSVLTCPYDSTNDSYLHFNHLPPMPYNARNWQRP
jgi:hypothetical protein